MTANTHYPGFDYAASDVIKFLAVIDFFTMMLKDGRIIHYTPDDTDAFKKWLLSHKIKDMRTEKGWVIS